MIELETDRLKIFPLHAENLRLLIDSQKEMEMKLLLNESEKHDDPELKQALKFRRLKVLADEANYIWHTNWLIVLDM